MPIAKLSPIFALVRKPFILLLAIVYLGITSGVMVNVHYCMGRIAEVNYGHDDADKCGKCGMDQKNGCCTTEHKFVKSADEHLFVKSFTNLTPAVAEVTQNFIQLVAPQPISKTVDYTRYHSPPDKRSNELHLYNGVFRI